MKEIDSTWRFLKDFYEKDPSSIVELINQALGVRSKMEVSGDNFDDLSNNIQPLNVNFDKPYLEFLRYVLNLQEKEIKENDDLQDSQTTYNLENRFLNHFWNIISEKKSVGIKETPKELAPYLILYALEIERDWFLYYGIFKSYFLDDQGSFEKLIDKLKKGVASWKRPYHFYSKLRNIISKLFWKKKLSPEQLFPLMTLFIVLKREWEYSTGPEYIKLKKESLIKKLPEDVINNALIFSLYRQFEDADESIINEIITINEKSESNSIPPIKIHPLVEDHIINSKSFEHLYRSNSTEEKFYEYVETEKLGKEYSGKRLLVDYMFPWTQIRENDIFVQSADSLSSLKSRIYLSLCKGEGYKKYWREKPDEGDPFDWIQLVPNVTTSGEYYDRRLSEYRKYLKPSGGFLFVWPKENDTINERIEKELSNFRHDMKNLTDDVSIENLKYKLNNIIQYTQAVQKAVEDIDCFLNNTTDQSLFEVAKKSIKELDNNSNLQNFVQKPDFNTVVRKIRLGINAFYHETQSIESLKTYIKDLKHLFIRACIDCISTKCMEQADSFEYKYTTLRDYISIAGVSKFDQENTIDINIIEFLERYIKYPPNKAKCAQLLKDYGNIEKNVTIKSNETILKVILDSIVENAITHGFPDDYQCDSPKIKFVLEESGDYMLLKVCNNGREIDITTDDYLTRGVFRGTTGHTGLGGFQIGKYAKMLGGDVKIPEKEDREWNTEIHIYLKK